MRPKSLIKNGQIPTFPITTFSSANKIKIIRWHNYLTPLISDSIRQVMCGILLLANSVTVYKS